MKKPSRILVVDDEMIICLGAQITLEDQGYEVLIAADGAQGLTIARRDRPDLILTDHMMPRIDGPTMIRRLRDDGLSVPVVLVTAIPRQNIGEQVEDLDIHYLEKPFRSETLLALIAGLLDKGED